MKENGDFDKMEPFMPGVKFNSIIDMEMGPEGKIYLLEYGSGWFSKNPDAAIGLVSGLFEDLTLGFGECGAGHGDLLDRG